MKGKMNLKHAFSTESRFLSLQIGLTSAKNYDERMRYAEKLSRDFPLDHGVFSEFEGKAAYRGTLLVPTVNSVVGEFDELDILFGNEIKLTDMAIYPDVQCRIVSINMVNEKPTNEDAF